jgi:hypothetical protein
MKDGRWQVVPDPASQKDAAEQDRAAAVVNFESNDVQGVLLCPPADNLRSRGDGDIVSGMKNKIQSSIANVTPAGMLAKRHRKWPSRAPQNPERLAKTRRR